MSMRARTAQHSTVRSSSSDQQRAAVHTHERPLWCCSLSLFSYSSLYPEHQTEAVNSGIAPLQLPSAPSVQSARSPEDMMLVPSQHLQPRPRQLGYHNGRLYMGDSALTQLQLQSSQVRCPAPCCGERMVSAAHQCVSPWTLVCTRRRQQSRLLLQVQSWESLSGHPGTRMRSGSRVSASTILQQGRGGSPRYSRVMASLGRRG